MFLLSLWTRQYACSVYMYGKYYGCCACTRGIYNTHDVHVPRKMLCMICIHFGKRFALCVGTYGNDNTDVVHVLINIYFKRLSTQLMQMIMYMFIMLWSHLQICLYTYCTIITEKFSSRNAVSLRAVSILLNVLFTYPDAPREVCCVLTYGTTTKQVCRVHIRRYCPADQLSTCLQGCDKVRRVHICICN